MKKLWVRKKKEVVLRQILPECLNCGKPLASDDIFCSYCGQKNVEKLNFGSFIGQLISGIFSYDSRFWSSFIPLLFKPGVVSRNYIDGKRKRYVNPFQLYLQVSIIFFLLLGLANSMSDAKVIPDDVNTELPAIQLDSIIPKDLKDEVFKEIDSVDQQVITNLSDGFKFGERLIDSTYQYTMKRDSVIRASLVDKITDFNVFYKRSPTIIDPNIALSELGYPITFWNTFFFEQTLKMRSNLEEFENDKGKNFLNKLVSKLSIGLFIFLPLFTLVFKLLYYRKHMNYMEHLVFVFHTQTVFFLLMTIYIIISLTSSSENLGIFILLFLIYLYMALRKFYGQGWFKTFVKFLLLNFVYMLIGGVAFVILAILAFMLN